MHARDWDRLAASYAEEVCDIFAHDRRHIIARWLRAHRLLHGGKTVLDIGCGIGSFFKKYGRHFGEKTGTDHSRRMLQFAAARCARVQHCSWLQADVTKLPAHLHNCGDLVVCSNVITFVSAPACARALRQVVRCARPGGWVMLILPALESHDAVTGFETGRTAPRRDPTAIVRRDDRMQRFYARTGAGDLAWRAGLRSVAVHKVWYPWSDEGVSRAPRGREMPWDWLVTGRR